jgi:hypothetical protein
MYRSTADGSGSDQPTRLVRAAHIGWARLMASGATQAAPVSRQDEHWAVNASTIISIVHDEIASRSGLAYVLTLA